MHSLHSDGYPGACRPGRQHGKCLPEHVAVPSPMVMSVPVVCPRASGSAAITATTAKSAAARMFMRPLLLLEVKPVPGIGSRPYNSSIKPVILQSAASQALLLPCMRSATLARSAAALTLAFAYEQSSKNFDTLTKGDTLCWELGVCAVLQSVRGLL